MSAQARRTAGDPARPRGQRARPVAESATDRLSRLLAMVPWLLTHQGVELDAAAAEFGITTDQLVKDLELLFVCGTPGHMPDDLIEADWEEGRVYLANAEHIARPLRLGVDEALALIVGLRTLAAVPGLGERGAVERALAKLEAAAGAAAQGAAGVRVALDEAADEDVLAAARDALARHRRVHLTYLVASRDETTERDVDPMRVLAMDGHWYLEGWCHRAESVRTFRLDRVVAMEVLDADGTPPADARVRDLGEGLFTPGADDQLVVLDLAPHALWVADHYLAESREELPDGTVRVGIRTADTGWVRRLCLRLGGAASVVAPTSLADQVRDAARAALTAYR